mmetsp:Transcript_18073/g.32775  ORF Transcript_18073/g.32775 Transcript_18073/m.32775 type:complete len:246 (+) Transcript_18073:64-801(+)
MCSASSTQQATVQGPPAKVFHITLAGCSATEDTCDAASHKASAQPCTTTHNAANRYGQAKSEESWHNSKCCACCSSGYQACGSSSCSDCKSCTRCPTKSRVSDVSQESYAGANYTLLSLVHKAMHPVCSAISCTCYRFSNLGGGNLDPANSLALCMYSHSCSPSCSFLHRGHRSPAKQHNSCLKLNSVGVGNTAAQTATYKASSTANRSAGNKTACTPDDGACGNGQSQCEGGADSPSCGARHCP